MTGKRDKMIAECILRNQYAIMNAVGTAIQDKGPTDAFLRLAKQCGETEAVLELMAKEDE